MSRFGESYGKVLRTACDAACEFYDTLDKRPVGNALEYDQLVPRFSIPLQAQPLDPTEVLNDLIQRSDDGLVRNPNPRFYSWVMGGTLPASVGADWMTTVWDQNAAQATCSPAAAAAEVAVGDWVKSLLELPAESTFAITNGCTGAHITCLAAARSGVLEQYGWCIERQGMFGAPAVTAVMSDGVHGSVLKALRILGFGTDNIVTVESGPDGEMLPDTLDGALATLAGPVVVVMQAGEIHTGVIDNFKALVPVAKKHKCWVHVDGAFGLWARVSSEHRALLEGVEDADSWATDSHKWLNTPYDAGFAIVRHPAIHFRTMCLSANYLSNDPCRNQRDWGLELSRRARGFATWAGLRQLGREGLSELVSRDCRCCRLLAESFARNPQICVVRPPVTNQLIISVNVPSRSAEENGNLTFRVANQIISDGQAFVGLSQFKGRKVIRFSVCNWGTNEDDVKQTVSAVESALATCLAA